MPTDNQILINIHNYIDSFLSKGVCIDYFTWLQTNGKLFTKIESNHPLFTNKILFKCKQHQCFNNSVEIAIKYPQLNYYEGLINVYDSFYEHAVNEYNGLILDFTSKQFNLINDISYIFVAPISFNTKQKYLETTKRTKENDKIFKINNINYFFLKQEDKI